MQQSPFKISYCSSSLGFVENSFHDPNAHFPELWYTIAWNGHHYLLQLVNNSPDASFGPWHRFLSEKRIPWVTNRLNKIVLHGFTRTHRASNKSDIDLKRRIFWIADQLSATLRYWIYHWKGQSCYYGISKFTNCRTTKFSFNDRIALNCQ